VDCKAIHSLFSCKSYLTRTDFCPRRLEQNESFSDPLVFEPPESYTDEDSEETLDALSSEVFMGFFHDM
jgi:hypothetical protein